MALESGAQICFPAVPSVWPAGETPERMDAQLAVPPPDVLRPPDVSSSLLPQSFQKLKQSYRNDGWHAKEDVLQWCQQKGIFGSTTVRFVSQKDFLRLNSFVSANTAWLSHFRTAIKTLNEFVWISEQPSQDGKMVLTGVIHYRFFQASFPQPSPLSLFPQRVAQVHCLQTGDLASPATSCQEAASGDLATWKLLFSLACHHALISGFHFLYFTIPAGIVPLFEVLGLRVCVASQDGKMVTLQAAVASLDFRSILCPRTS